MSHGKLREDKDCLNCGHHVEEKFCPNCGQENIETRQPFYYLFTHFFEDFTHYDGQFWGTLKNLFISPGKLTNIYLEGKRQKFVPPVKLYIFVSFVTFFLFAVFPPFKINFNGTKKSNQTTTQNSNFLNIKKAIDSLESQKTLSEEDRIQLKKFNSLLKDSTIINDFGEATDMTSGLGNNFHYKGYTSKESFDAATAKNPSFFDFMEKPFAHKFFELKEKGVSKGDILKKLFETSFQNLPKALFIYLPVFAFFLWVFHSKKKWWYFDHGVFTLHYFSFLLLNILIFSLLNTINNS